MATRKALTLAELVLVLSILIALSSIAIPICTDNLSTAARNTTQASLTTIRDATLHYWQDTKHVTLDGVTSSALEAQRFQIAWLFKNPVTNDQTIQFDPNSRSGWNGPYLASSTGNVATYGLGAMLDGWNHLIAVQYVNPSDTIKDVRFVSAGPNGIVNIPANIATSALTTIDIGDDLYVALISR